MGNDKNPLIAARGTEKEREEQFGKKKGKEFLFLLWTASVARQNGRIEGSGLHRRSVTFKARGRRVCLLSCFEFFPIPSPPPPLSNLSSATSLTPPPHSFPVCLMSSTPSLGRSPNETQSYKRGKGARTKSDHLISEKEEGISKSSDSPLS